MNEAQYRDYIKAMIFAWRAAASDAMGKPPSGYLTGLAVGLRMAAEDLEEVLRA